MPNFYCILLINNSTGLRGYVLTDGDKILVSTGGAYDVRTRQFNTYQDAQQFIRDKKLERQGIKAYIRDDSDVMKEATNVRPSTTAMYYIEDMIGRKLYWNTQNNIYEFRHVDIGYPVWPSRQECEEAVRKLNFDFEVIIKTHEPKK